MSHKLGFAAGKKVATGVFCFDILSPYSAIYVQRLPEIIAAGVDVKMLPVFLPGLLKSANNKGPAEVTAKRMYAYQQCIHLAHTYGMKEFGFPPVHPFPSIAPMRLLLGGGNEEMKIRLPSSSASSTSQNDEKHVESSTTISVYPSTLPFDTIRKSFDMIWRHGHDITEPTMGLALWARLCQFPHHPPLSPAVMDEAKSRLTANTDACVKMGAFGVPTMFVYHHGHQVDHQQSPPSSSSSSTTSTTSSATTTVLDTIDTTPRMFFGVDSIDWLVEYVKTGPAMFEHHQYHKLKDIHNPLTAAADRK